MAHADWIIDLGPGAGHDGGRVVFEGTPAELVAKKSTLTGQHLAAYVGGAAKPPPRVERAREAEPAAATARRAGTERTAKSGKAKGASGRAR